MSLRWGVDCFWWGLDCPHNHLFIYLSSSWASLTSLLLELITSSFPTPRAQWDCRIMNSQEAVVTFLYCLFHWIGGNVEIKRKFIAESPCSGLAAYYSNSLRLVFGNKCSMKHIYPNTTGMCIICSPSTNCLTILQFEVLHWPYPVYIR